MAATQNSLLLYSFCCAGLAIKARCKLACERDLRGKYAKAASAGIVNYSEEQGLSMFLYQ